MSEHGTYCCVDVNCYLFHKNANRNSNDDYNSNVLTVFVDSNADLNSIQF